MKTSRKAIRPSAHAFAGVLMTLVFAVSFYIPAYSASPSLADDTGIIELVFQSELPDLSENSSVYSLAGATFGVFADYQCEDRVAELVTDEGGQASSPQLHAGRYFIRQELAAPGFALSPRLYQADVAIGKSVRVDTSATPAFCAPEVVVRELNAETGNAVGTGAASLGNARYEISYYDGYGSESVLDGAMRTWTFRSDDNGEVRLDAEHLVEGSPLFEGPHGLLVLPLGHYTVTVEDAPAGFECVTRTLEADVTSESRTEIEVLCAFTPFEERMQVIRGDVMFRKTDENGTPLAGIPFLLSCEDGSDEPEQHLVITDENGDFTSHAGRMAHAMNANGNDAAVVAQVDGVYTIDESRLVGPTGIWFSRDARGVTASPDESRGALPYGSYTLRELPCAANAGMNLVTTRFSIYQDGFTVKLDDIVNTTPGISSAVCDARDSDKLIRPMSQARVLDTVSYHNLVVGTPYRIVVTASSRSTGASVPGPNGDPAISYVEFTPKNDEGSISLELELDTSGLAGDMIAIENELVSTDGVSIALDGTGELEVEPIIVATAQDAHDLDKYVMGSDAAILERISYEGLRPATGYVATCTLNDRATGNALRDAQGAAITRAVEFSPDTTQGLVEIEIPVDTSAIAGHDIVVFDRIADAEGRTIASHQDLEDEAQSVKTVKLSSNAVDKLDGDKTFDANSDSVTIVDTISYANLVAGAQYQINGVLMDKETGTALMADGAPVTAHASFVPREVSGSTDVEYSFNASAQSSQVLVAFESLEHEGNVIAEHADLEDVAQTVTSTEIDPDIPADGGTTQSAAPTIVGGMVSTGDVLMRSIVAALVMMACAGFGVAYAAHRRRRTLESITRTSDMGR